jgi:hypothetical protein
MEQQQSTHKYTALDETKREIRLLHLLPSLTIQAGDKPSNDVIHCTFSLASLSAPPAFEALSYAWGDTKGVIRIQLHGNDVLITANLHCALRHLRYADRERILWVDALCIDQGNLDERTSQVDQMRYVYSLAQRVVVFLGDSCEGSDIAMDFIESMVADPNLHFWTKLEPHVTIQGISWSSHNLQDALCTFFSLPWFSRTWTVQEYALAHEVVFRCGRRLLDRKDLRLFCKSWLAHAEECCAITSDLWSIEDKHDVALMAHFKNVIPLGTHLNNVIDMEKLREHQNQHSILELDMRFRIRECHDIRDKIYGLLALTDDEFIQANYGISVEEAFINVLMASVRHTKSLDVLSYRTGLSSLQLELPSFVPDWSASPAAYSAGLLSNRADIIVLYRLYAASGQSKAQFYLDSIKRANTRGIIFDTIANIGGRISHSPEEDAFWETLCCGVMRCRNDEEDEFRRYVKTDRTAYLE